MDLWIRSQDRKCLIKPSDIGISGTAIVGYFDRETEYEDLGNYKSEERAIEVLDEIDNIKFYKYMASLDIKSFVTIIEKKYSPEEQSTLFKQMNTYEMPKE